MEGISTKDSEMRIGELSFTIFQYESPPMNISKGKSSSESVLGSANCILRPCTKVLTSCGTAGCGESVRVLSKALIGIVQFDQAPVILNRTCLRWLDRADCDSNVETFSPRCSMVFSFRSSIKVSVIKLDWFPLSSTQRVSLLSPVGPVIHTRAVCK